MNVMQKITLTVVMLSLAVLLAISASSGLGTGDWPGVVVVAVASGIVCAILVAVFARGTVIVRLQRGTVVLALAVSGLALSVPLVPDKYVPGWQRRLARYPSLRPCAQYIEKLRTSDAMDAADSVISEMLLSTRPELWHDYGSVIVSVARRHEVAVESLAGLLLKETPVRAPRMDTGEVVALDKARRGAAAPVTEKPLSELSNYELIAKYLATLDEAKVSRTARKYGITEAEVARRLWPRFQLNSMLGETTLVAQGRPPRLGGYRPPSDAWVPDWPARLALACSVLLVGLAIVVVLGLLRRKPKSATGADHAT